MGDRDARAQQPAQRATTSPPALATGHRAGPSPGNDAQRLTEATSRRPSQPCQDLLLGRVRQVLGLRVVNRLPPDRAQRDFEARGRSGGRLLVIRLLLAAVIARIELAHMRHEQQRALRRRLESSRARQRLQVLGAQQLDGEAGRRVP
eukprot:611730-Prymnesium_polylepis.2